MAIKFDELLEALELDEVSNFNSDDMIIEVELAIYESDIPELGKTLKKYGIELLSINPYPTGWNLLAEVKGTKENLKKWLIRYVFGRSDEVQEFYPELFESYELDESCKKELKEDLNDINKKIIASCDPESILIEVLNACKGNLTWAASDLGLTLSELNAAIDYYELTQDFDNLHESLNESLDATNQDIKLINKELERNNREVSKIGFKTHPFFNDSEIAVYVPDKSQANLVKSIVRDVARKYGCDSVVEDDNYKGSILFSFNRNDSYRNIGREESEQAKQMFENVIKKYNIDYDTALAFILDKIDKDELEFIINELIKMNINK